MARFKTDTELLVQLNAKKFELAKLRDTLRQQANELQDLADNAGEAVEYLDSAVTELENCVDTLSQLV